MPKQKQTKEYSHKPVLVQEVLDCLDAREGQSYLDLTAGYGGHAQAILGITKAPGETVLVDRDEQAVAALNKRFAGSGVRIMHQDFLSALQDLQNSDKKFDLILADLGVSSPHLEDAERGFSFNLPGPLDMRMDIRQEMQAEQLVNYASEAELTQILTKYGEEPKARTIARNIISSRPVNDTETLANGPLGPDTVPLIKNPRVSIGLIPPTLAPLTMTSLAAEYVVWPFQYWLMNPGGAAKYTLNVPLGTVTV